MSKLGMLLIIGSGLVLLGLAALAFAIGQESRLLPDNRIPEFAMKAFAAPTASKAGLFITKDGAITRYAVHLGREDVPVYLHSMADEKIGKGEDITYEAEIYPDGSEVYEIYRRVEGKEKQLSVLHRDRSIKYVGTQMEEKEIPEKIQAAIKNVKGFTFEKCIFKEGSRFAEYHVKGLIAGTSYRARIGREGNLLSLQRRIAGDFEVAVQD
ncbi:MAG TPA: hypothetical protein VNM14_00260 [Planctomycetota bacterium]|jgi:hypothetical protein|nr:hypothetical protein [Planctomycetota bacterium]